MDNTAIAFVVALSPLLEAAQDGATALGLEELVRAFCIWPAPLVFTGLTFGPLLPCMIGCAIGSLLV
jgi:hypothetical protein